jgi:hypothetical protein
MAASEGRTLLSAAFDFDVSKLKPNFKGGGQQCPPHTANYCCRGGGVMPTNVVPRNFP